MSCPAKLQINQSGAWRDVLRFDIDQLVDEKQFLAVAAELVEYSGQEATTTMRIVTDEPLPGCIAHWSADGGWKPDGNTPASAAEPVPNRPSTLTGASGPAAAENGSKAPESKGA